MAVNSRQSTDFEMLSDPKTAKTAFATCGLTADLKERSAETAEDSAIAADSEVKFGFWRLAAYQTRVMSEMSSPKVPFSREMSFMSSLAAMS